MKGKGFGGIQTRFFRTFLLRLFHFHGEGQPLVEYLLGFDDDGVVLAEELQVVLHLAYIIYYVAVDVAFEETTALLQHEVAAAQLTFLCELRELLQEVLGLLDEESEESGEDEPEGNAAAEDRKGSNPRKSAILAYINKLNQEV